MKFELSFRVTLYTSVLTFQVGERGIDSNIPPNRVDKQPDKVEPVTVGFLVLDKSLGVGLILSKSTQSAQEMRGTQYSRIEVIRVNVFAEIDDSCNLVGLLPH